MTEQTTDLYSVLHCEFFLSFFFLQYVGDEEFTDSLKGFSAVKKEHAVFTDTHL